MRKLFKSALFALLAMNCQADPFQIGFELQTMGRMLSDDVIPQYKRAPLLIYEHVNGQERRELWHIEIDGKDIEFITAPIADSEQALFDECAETLQKAVNVLRDLSEGSSLSFFFDQLKDKLKEAGGNLRTTPLFRNTKVGKVRVQHAWNKIFQPQVTIQMPLRKVINVSYELFRNSPQQVMELNSALPLKEGYEFLNIQEGMGEGDIDEAFSDWKRITLPNFNTAIDGLMFIQAITMNKLYRPCKYDIRRINNIINNYREVDETCPKNTDAQIQSLIEDAEKEEKEKREKSYNVFAHMDLAASLIKYNQVNAKARIPIMSRRPFSDMFAEIKNEENFMLSDSSSKKTIKKGYLNAFDKIKTYNNSYDISEMNYQNGMYGRRFFNKKGKEANIYNLFHKKSMEADLPYVGKWLACHGVLTPFMTKYLKQQPEFLKLLKLRPKDVVGSVEYPRIETNVDLEREKIVYTQGTSKIDLMSPPILLSSNAGSNEEQANNGSHRERDSMGAYRNRENIRPDLYGGAVLEFRNIGKAVYSEYNGKYGYFLSKAGKDPAQGENREIERDMRTLFNIVTRSVNE